jgi:hypothetical protein
MTLQVAAAQTAPDTWSFTVTGVTGPTFVIDYGDGSAPVTTPVHASGTTVVSHQYTHPGHQAYTVTVTAGRTPYASTLLELSMRYPGPAESMFAALATGPGDTSGNYEAGEEFTAQADGMVTALKFFRTSTATVTTRRLNLWHNGTLIGSADTVESAPGWVTAPLAAPVPIVAGQTYIASYNTFADGGYVDVVPDTAPHLTSTRHLYWWFHNEPPSIGVGSGDTGTLMVLADVVFVPNLAPTESMYANPAPLGTDTAGIDPGLRFTVAAAGIITGVRWYRASESTATSRVVNLWSAAGVKLGSGTTTNETGTGWRTTPLASPVAVAAGTYVVSYDAASAYGYGSPTPLGSSANLAAVAHVYGVGGAFPDVPAPTFYMFVDVEFHTAATLTSLAGLAADPRIPTLADIPRATDTVTTAVTVDVGPATIWATVIAGTPPTVQVDTLVGNPETVTGWTVTRDVPGDSAPIWIGTTHSGAMSFVDVTPPLAVPITYRLNLRYADGHSITVAAAPVTVTGTTSCFVTDPLSGGTVAVEIARWPVRRRDPRRAVLTVLGRADPVVVSDVHSTPSGTVTFLTRTDQATAALMSVLTASGFVVIRTQPGTSMPPMVTVSVGEIAETRYTGTSGDQRRLNEVAVQEIADLPATAQPLGADLEGLSTLGATLLDLSLLRPTLRQLSMIETGV